MKKRIIGTIAMLMLLIVGGLFIKTEVKASTGGHTREEAVQWAKNQLGKALDMDGVPVDQPYQCVDLTKYYYQYLGQKVPYGDAKDYVNYGNFTPSGWSYQSSPQPGDVAVSTGGKYGHVAIVIAVSGSNITIVEQNGGYPYCTQRTCAASGFNKFIRPDFPSSSYDVRILLWATGLQNGEGDNPAKTARLLGTTTLKKAAGARYTLNASDYTATVVPRGYTMSTEFGTDSYTGSWQNYKLGEDYVTQPASNVRIEFYCYPTTYNITYNLNGGTNASSNPSTYKVLYGVTFAAPTRAGYTFAGWTNSAGQTITGINPGADASHSTGAELIQKLSSRTIGNQTVTANWTPISYTVSYNANGGSGAPAAQTKYHNQTLTLSTVKPTRSGGSLTGYTVTLNANGGSVSSTSLTAARTQSYTFKNWNTKADGSGTSYASGGSYTANSGVTLYAQWNSSVRTSSITLPVPTRSGYTFNGWATSASASSGTTGSYTPTGNVTLYALWDLNAPSITSQPASVSTMIGKTVNFKVSASGSGLSYQWQYRNSASDSWKNSTMACAKTNTFTFTAAESHSGHQYRCLVSNGKGTVTSNTATVTVRPLITTQPKNTTIAIDGTVKLTVAAKGTNLTYQWQYRNSASDSWKNSTMACAKTNTFSFKAAESHSGHQYRCLVSNGKGTATSNTATVTVRPLITTQPKNTVVTVGGTVKLTVAAKGTNLTYQWQYRNSASDSWKNSTMACAKTNTFTFTAASSHSGHQYRCAVSNGKGTTYTNAVTLTVK